MTQCPPGHLGENERKPLHRVERAKSVNSQQSLKLHNMVPQLERIPHFREERDQELSQYEVCSFHTCAQNISCVSSLESSRQITLVPGPKALLTFKRSVLKLTISSSALNSNNSWKEILWDIFKENLQL